MWYSRARARLINRYSACDVDHVLPGRQSCEGGVVYICSRGEGPRLRIGRC
nr:MAG TPA: hypothetical protein [Caudoviricetes sp.]